MNVLNAKDLEWSKQHLPAAMVPESENTEEVATVAEPAIEPPKKCHTPKMHTESI